MIFGFIALVLLSLRAIIIKRLLDVLLVQLKLLKRPIDPDVRDFRISLHRMTIAMLVGNVAPVILDIVVLADALGVISHYRTEALLSVYAISNALSTLFAALMIHRMYSLANQTQEVDDLERAHAESKK